MSKTQAKASTQELVKAGETFNAAANGMEGVNTQEAFDMLETADSSLLEELSGEYLSFKGAKANEVFHYLCEGITKATIDGEEKDVVKLRDRDGNGYIAGSAVLVNAAKKLTTLPTYIRVTYLGTKKSANGTYADLRVHSFPGATK